jgi:hypothetical protein
VAHVAVDLDSPDAARLPDPADMTVLIDGVPLARLPVAPGADALALLLALLRENADGMGLQGG